MKKRGRSNEYCDVCGKIHRCGKCTGMSKKEISEVTTDVAINLIKRATAHLYLSRDITGDAVEFTESDVVKEVGKDEFGGNSKKDK